MLRLLFFCVALFAAMGVRAASPLKLDTLTIGSKSYRKVTILGANATDLYFKHEGGFANVKLKFLSPELQHQFNYDEVAALEAERKQLEDDILYQHQVASNRVVQAQKAARAARLAAVTSEESLADPISEESPLGKAGPDLKVEKWLGQKPVLTNKVVLVAFWAPWSVPCKKYIPELNALQKKFPEKFVVMGVCSDPEAEILEMAEPKPEFATALDAKSSLSDELGVTSVPSVLLLDMKGVVRYLGHPSAVTEKKIQSLLPKLE
jgi:thiol-disulfide isomerase/thioredoxin